MSSNACAGCDLPIIDRYLSKVLDLYWHHGCVRCCNCHQMLEDKCYSRDGKLYCKKDFYRLFGAKCVGCKEGLQPTDSVYRVGLNSFHLKCLACARCQKQFSTGDQLFVAGDQMYLCERDYENVGDLSTQKSSVSSSDYENEENNENDEKTTGNTIGDGEDDDGSLNGKRRGPRTTIKAKQLETLRTAFAATPKPSRHIREKLAQETGLSMRVIQVWFQNRRSKERRIHQMNQLGGRRNARLAATVSQKSADIHSADHESLENSPPDPGAFSFYTQGPSPLDDFATQRISYHHYNRPVMTQANLHNQAQSSLEAVGLVKNEYQGLNLPRLGNGTLDTDTSGVFPMSSVNLDVFAHDSTGLQGFQHQHHHGMTVTQDMLY